MGKVYKARLTISRETETHWANGVRKQEHPNIKDDETYPVPGWRLRMLKDAEAQNAILKMKEYNENG